MRCLKWDLEWKLGWDLGRNLEWKSTLRLASCLALALAVFLPAAGCSKAGTKKKKPRAAAAQPGEGDVAEADAGDEPMEEAAADDSAEVVPEGVDPDTAMNVDGSRIAVMSPAGWVRAKQSKDYLVKYVPGIKKTYPAIVVTAADAPDGMAEVDAGGQRDFVKAIADSLAATYTKNGKSTLVKKPAGVKLGPHFGATWAAPATIKVSGVSESIDRASYAVVIGGRMYTVEVRAPKGKLDAEGRAAARAVAAALGPADAAAPAAAAVTEPAAAATDAAPTADAAQ